jgi:hypothetical protein
MPAIAKAIERVNDIKRGGDYGETIIAKLTPIRSLEYHYFVAGCVGIRLEAKGFNAA